jgi:thioredoxin 1
VSLFHRRPKPIALESASQLEALARSGTPVLVDFFQFGCAPCRVMDGIVDELAGEYQGAVHVVKANAANVPEVFERYKVRSTPTFILFTAREGATTITQRWRASGLVKKDVLARSLESAGARRPPG